MFSNPCARFSNPCARINYANPCARITKPCARITKSCARITNSCARFSNPCAQFSVIIFRMALPGLHTNARIKAILLKCVLMSYETLLTEDWQSLH